MSVGQCFQNDNYNPDRAVAWVREIIEPTVSPLPAAARVPRGIHRVPAQLDARPRDTRSRMPYPSTHSPPSAFTTTATCSFPTGIRRPGTRLDGSVALGMPLFGESRWSGLAWGQASWVDGAAGRTWLLVGRHRSPSASAGAVGLPKNGRLFTLGGNLWFRGFDVFERQGSCAWLGSVEVRIPIHRDVDFDVADRLMRLKSLCHRPVLRRRGHLHRRQVARAGGARGRDWTAVPGGLLQLPGAGDDPVRHRQDHRAGYRAAILVRRAAAVLR